MVSLQGGQGPYLSYTTGDMSDGISPYIIGRGNLTRYMVESWFSDNGMKRRGELMLSKPGELQISCTLSELELAGPCSIRWDGWMGGRRVLHGE